MEIRFTDNMLSNIGDSGFIIRNRIPKALQISVGFFFASLLIYFGYSNGNKVIFISSLFIVMSLLCLVTIVFAEKLRTLVLASEFQSALLSSGIRLGTRFCLIVKNDGNIVYMDPGFYQTFPDLKNSNIRTIDDLLNGAEIPDTLKEDVKAVLEQKRSERILLPFKKSDGSIINIMTTIDILPRPKFYFVIRGRDYIEKRDNKPEEQIAKEPVSYHTQNSFSNNLDLVELVRPLYTNNEQIIIANKSGAVVFISPSIEKWLGYEIGEIIQSEIRINQLFNKYIGNNLIKKSQGDFIGEVILERKDRSLMPLEVNQTAINQDGEIIGISAVINLG